MDSTIMSTTSYHKEDSMSIPVNSKGEMDSMLHALRVLPAIITSLNDAGVRIVAWDYWNGETRLHTSRIKALKEWALFRVVHPELKPWHDQLYSYEVAYVIDGIRVFCLLTKEEQEEMYPL